jgi:hypothetical protein
MRTPLVLAALLSLGGAAKKEPAPASAPVHCPTWIYFEPHFFSRHIADVPPGAGAQIQDEPGPWVKVKVGSLEGYAARGALAPPPGTGPGHESTAALVKKDNLVNVDAWVIRYEGDRNGARLRARLEELPAFLREGDLEEAK